VLGLQSDPDVNRLLLRDLDAGVEGNRRSVVARTMRQRWPRRRPPECVLIEYESVSRPPGEVVDRRTFLKAAAGTLTALSAPGYAETAGATLYNGIRLAAPWPPVRRGIQPTPLHPPYLVDRPEIVPIDVGRQLFIDDFLVEETSLERVFHRPEYHPSNPVLRPTTRWEKYDEYAERTNTRSNPAAMPFSDGVFYDPQDRLFKMWYMGGYSQNTCLRCRAMASNGAGRRLTSFRGRISRWRCIAIRVRSGWISRCAIRRGATRWRRGTTNTCSSTSRATAFIGAKSVAVAPQGIGRPSSTIRSGRCGSSAFAT
jgi:hypothetical protein